MIEYAKRILEKAGFTILEMSPQYRLRNYLDMIAATIFAIISILCVIFDPASIVVLFLNGLCLFRMIIKCSMKSSEITDSICREKSIHKNATGKYYYFLKAFFVTVVSVTLWIFIIISKFDMTDFWVKCFTILMILTVLLDDIENAYVGMLKAYIDPFK